MGTHYGIWTDGETTAHLRENVVELVRDDGLGDVDTLHLTIDDLRTILERAELRGAEEAVGLDDDLRTGAYGEDGFTDAELLTMRDPAIDTEPDCCS